MSEFFYRDSNEVVGPISGATLKSLCQRGKISPQTEIRKDDGPWQPAGKVKGLAELFTLETARVVMVNHRSPTSREENGKSATVDESQRPRLAAALPGEVVLFKGRSAFLRGLPFFSTRFSVGLLVLLVVVAIIQPIPSTLIQLGTIAIFPSLWLAFAFYCVRGMRYEVTTERTIFVSPSVERMQFNLRHEDLVDVFIKRSLLQRLFGTGDLQLRTENDTAGMRYIPNLARPQRIADEIKNRMTP